MKGRWDPVTGEAERGAAGYRRDFHEGAETVELLLEDTGAVDTSEGRRADHRSQTHGKVHQLVWCIDWEAK